MHEVEEGKIKVLVTHLIRIIDAQDSTLLDELDRR